MLPSPGQASSNASAGGGLSTAENIAEARFLVVLLYRLLVVGCWLLVVGCRLSVVGCWLLVVGGWWLVVGCWLLVVGCWLLVVGCWLLAVGCWSLVVGRWLLVVGCWLLANFADALLIYDYMSLDHSLHHSNHYLTCHTFRRRLTLVPKQLVRWI
jgi:hypothetical protein